MPNVPQPGRTGGPLAALTWQTGPLYGEEVPVPLPVVVIGRGAGADLRIDDDSVSAQHARLEFDAGGWRITDLESVNGTSVEGVKLAPNVPTPLPYGSTVRLGGVKMIFTEMEAADPEAARAEYVPPPPKTTLREEPRGFHLPVWLLFVILVILAAIGIILYFTLAAPPAPAPAPAVQTATGAPAPPPAPVRP